MEDIFIFGHLNFSKDDSRHVNITERTDYSYLLSYKKSADALVSIASEKGIIQGEIFPIILLYRKYIETLLKRIIEKMEDEYDGVTNDLVQMWEHIEIMYKREETIEEFTLMSIKNTVRAFHKVNPKSSGSKQFYRNDTLDDRITVDVKEMKNAIERMHRVLV